MELRNASQPTKSLLQTVSFCRWRLRRLARCWNVGCLPRCVAQPRIVGVRIQYDALPRILQITVPPVNSDQFDKLGFVAQQSFAFRTCSNGLFRLPQRLVSEPCGPPVGDPGLTSSARSASALCQAPEVEPC